jgi:hypothetical protein
MQVRRNEGVKNIFQVRWSADGYSKLNLAQFIQDMVPFLSCYGFSFHERDSRLPAEELQ